ncbi:MAG TPA: hypothetical protein VIM31_03700 [Candidatus Microsaccharimonas sp.]|jgi:hypothetical protein
MNENYSKIESADISEVRLVFVASLKSYLYYLEKDLPAAIQAAYEITGLAATSYASTLINNDPIDGILTVAGELEINPTDAEVLRQELVKKIKNL